LELGSPWKSEISMAIVVRIPTPLRKYTAGKAEVEVEGTSVREVFESVESAHQGVKEKVFDDSGSIRRFINIFVNGEDVRHLQGPDTTVKAGDELSIVPAIAGGLPQEPSGARCGSPHFESTRFKSAGKAVPWPT